MPGNNLSTNDIMEKRDLRILIACEESQVICKAFRDKGFIAYSCDLLEPSGGHHEWHFQRDIFEVLDEFKFDLIIAHPDCTYLTVSGARWFYHPDDSDLPMDMRRPHPSYPNRREDQAKAAEFFMKLYNSDAPHVAVENPIGVMSSLFRKPDQIVHPYYFGDSVTKATCWWLKDLPMLIPTNVVDKGNIVEFSSGKRMHEFFAKSFGDGKTRSKTFQGMAEAIVDQWGGYLLDKYVNKAIGVGGHC